MRTIPFRSVYESIVRRMGYDPLGDAIKQDVGRNVLEHINNRVAFIWSAWDWPELNRLEWRAFRKVWTAALTVLAGDELYYFGDGITVPGPTVDPPTPGANAGYYTALQPSVNSPPGPANANYSALVLSDRYIEYAQTGQNVIGDLLDVYPSNPREKTSRTQILKSVPSSKGIDVLTSLDIAWVRYRIPASQFSLTPYLPGTIGGPTVVYYDPASGECFMGTALPAGAGPVAGPHGGTLIPFPFFLSGYVRAAAYADAILETAMEAKIRLALSQSAAMEAQEYLQREIDNLSVQGQRMYYRPFPPSRRPHYRSSPSLGSGAVSAI